MHLMELSLVALSGDVDLSPLGAQQSLLEPALTGGASLKNTDVLGELPALDALYLESACLRQLGERCLAPTLTSLGLMRLGASLSTSLRCGTTGSSGWACMPARRACPKGITRCPRCLGLGALRSRASTWPPGWTRVPSLHPG
ncbi:hypothetical protein ACIBQ5_36295 [Streptomyces massasporeus]|uniref:hypothetical protein n=1 Tax=Streptomyces massasporeus TaxID=67324 RepID=UPI0037B4EB1B